MTPRYLLLQGATIIDGRADEPITRGSVLIQGDRITAVGDVDAIVAPDEDVDVIDATGRTVMPGMIDCHFHCAYTDVTCWEDYDQRQSIEHSTILAARNAQTLLEVGFTAARDVGSRALIALAVRDMINAGVIVGPRLMAGGRIISTTGGLADALGYWARNDASLGHVVDGAHAVLLAVREQIKYGADNIKIEASGTGISAFSDSRKQTMTMEEMHVAVQEAHRNGVRVACHAQATEGIKNAVRAGVDTIEHGSFLDEEGAALMSEAGTLFVPTISVLYLYVNRGPEVGVPRWVVENMRRDLDEHVQSVKLALSERLPMAVGSDSGHKFNPQEGIACELEYMVETGFTPMQAIQSATSVGAEVMGLQDRIGHLAPGMFADFLVIDGDPLEDITVLQDRRRLERIYKAGRLVAGTAAPLRRPLDLASVFEAEPGETAEVEASAMRPCCFKTKDEIDAK
jgi:imidazolonepropionase-like amidohydrolase